jgi:hypothetical protein
MSTDQYIGVRERNFPQALIHLLEEQYGLLGSRRVLELMAQDVQALIEQFYPTPEHLSSGWMLFTGTRAQGGKAHPGQRAGDYELVTLAWPVLTAEDIQARIDQPDTEAQRQSWFQERLVRLIEYGWEQPDGAVLLTQADLALMLGLAEHQVSLLLAKARQASGKPLITKGYYFDQGSRPTHKEQVVGLYESGLDEAQVAQQCQHALQSVGHYLRDYERVKLLLAHRTPVERISRLIGLQPSVVAVYAKLVAKYHPDLLADPGRPEEVQ